MEKTIPLDDKVFELYNEIIELSPEDQTYILIKIVQNLKSWPVSLTKKSKFLSLILRHNPEKIGIEMDTKGWVKVSDLCRLMPISKSELQEIVQTDEKGRYLFSPDSLCIRACQGHSIKVDVEMVESKPPEFLWHGTTYKYLDSIKEKGLLPMGRQFVHLSVDIDTATKVGSRHGKPVMLKIASIKMFSIGHKFWISNNGIWQVIHVPIEYIQIM